MVAQNNFVIPPTVFEKFMFPQKGWQTGHTHFERDDFLVVQGLISQKIVHTGSGRILVKGFRLPWDGCVRPDARRDGKSSSLSPDIIIMNYDGNGKWWGPISPLGFVKIWSCTRFWHLKNLAWKEPRNQNSGLFSLWFMNWGTSPVWYPSYGNLNFSRTVKDIVKWF